MDSTRQDVRDDIIKIRENLDRFRGRILIKQLIKLGIRATAVSFTANGFPQFRPCFFVPRGLQLSNAQHLEEPYQYESEEGTPEELPVVKEHTERLPRRVRLPSILETLHTSKLDALEQEGFELSNNTTLSNSGFVLNRLQTRILEGSQYSTGSPLSKGKWPIRPEIQLSEHRFQFKFWQVFLSLEDTTHAVPHAIIDVLVDTSNPFIELTAGEVKAILRVIEIRMSFASYQDNFILPLLVLSYLGRDHARIIHAHHDGNHLNIQFSSVVQLDNRSVKNLLAYYCSEPVGVTTMK